MQHSLRDFLKTALVLVPDAISIGLDMVIMSKVSKKEVFEAKSELEGTQWEFVSH